VVNQTYLTESRAIQLEKTTVLTKLIWLFYNEKEAQNEATEFGLFVTLDGGQKWMKWTHGVPTVPVRDIGVHPRENDLIIGTHGRSIYIIDDISPLREISDEVVGKKLHVFAVPDAHQYVSGCLSSHQSPGDTPFTGENRRTGAAITYHLIPRVHYHRG